MNGRTTSRRTVAKGLAWATPAVIVAAPTPTVAASAVTCPPMPTGSAWTTTISTPRTSAPATWSGNTFTMLTDANSTTATTTVTTTATIPVTAGVTYNFQFLIQAAMGYTSVGTCATVNSTLSIDVLAGALPTNLFRGYTQTGAGTRVQPPASCTTNGARSSQFGNNGIAGSVLTATGSYTATSTGTIMLRMTFTMPATTAGNNDDWKVTPSLVSCT